MSKRKVSPHTQIKLVNPTEASFTLKSSIQIERKHKQKAFFGSRVTSHTKFQSNAHDRRVRIFVSMNERQWARGVQLTNMCFIIALLQNVREGEYDGLGLWWDGWRIHTCIFVVCMFVYPSHFKMTHENIFGASRPRFRRTLHLNFTWLFFCTLPPR